jgi:hypothetical protein
MTMTTPADEETWDPLVAAEAGAAHLDLIGWPDWRRDIDTGRLDMGQGIYRGGRRYCKGCLGAQLDFWRLTRDDGVPVPEALGEYERFVRAIYPGNPTDDPKLITAWAVAHGFMAPHADAQDGTGLDDILRRYQALTAAWRRVLAATNP